MREESRGFKSLVLFVKGFLGGFRFLGGWRMVGFGRMYGMEF